ncbi:MAG: PH domain-containing protein [Ruminococcus sp.]|nr:PH domain-containing protein [Ruminococcus sp.]
MKKYQPDRHGLISVRILTTLFSVILSVISKIYVISEFLLFIVIIFIVTISIFVMFVYFPLYFSSLAYETTSTEVIKHSGVIVRSHQAIRFDSIQYTTVVSSPLSQYTGFNFVIFFIYGGQLRLDFLSRQDTIEILKSTRSSGMREV